MPAPEFREGEQLKWQVTSSGGTYATSGSYQLEGTVSQTATDKGSSGDYNVSSGFWQGFGFAESGACDCIPGDANGDEIHNSLDVTYIINYLYKAGPAPIPYLECSGDASCDCTVNLLDATYLINFLYKHGPLPCYCEDWNYDCGPLK